MDKRKKKVILVGLPNPIKFKSKKFVLQTLYKRAKKNPFLVDSTYEEYLEFLLSQIKELGSSDISIDKHSPTLEKDIFNALKKMNWIKVFNAILIGVITTKIGV